MSAHVLVINGNTAEGTAKIVALGARPYGEGYAQALRFFEPRLDITILNAADGDTLPAGAALADFDGIAWTGSALGAYEDRPEVAHQIELARAVHETRVPCFGSCWGQQIMCQALGGEVRANPKGTEIGVAREITRNGAGDGHPMFASKQRSFDALAIHRDEVVTLPQGAEVLAANAMSDIQAIEMAGDSGDFWSVQYHPEFDLATMAVLYERDAATLLKQELYEDQAAVDQAVADFRTLNSDPSDATLAKYHGLGADILDPAIRMAELGNWLGLRVLPRMSSRV